MENKRRSIQGKGFLPKLLSSFFKSLSPIGYEKGYGILKPREYCIVVRHNGFSFIAYNDLYLTLVTPR